MGGGGEGYLTVQNHRIPTLDERCRRTSCHGHIRPVQHVHVHRAGLAGAQVVGRDAVVDINVGPVNRVQGILALRCERGVGERSFTDPPIGGRRVGVRQAGEGEGVDSLLAGLEQGVAHRDVGRV